MAETRESSHPPSEPQLAALRESVGGVDRVAAVDDDRPARLQLLAAMLLGLVLVATGLYLWRRPNDRSSDRAIASADVDQEVGGVASLAGGRVAGAASLLGFGERGSIDGLVLGEPRVVSCHDKGPGKTPPEACDRLPQVEQALLRAIEQSSSCVPASAGGGSLEYLADVSFTRKKISVFAPKDGRSLRSGRAISACLAAVRQSMQSLAIDGIPHEHARYKIAVTATYGERTP